MKKRKSNYPESIQTLYDIRYKRAEENFNKIVLTKEERNNIMSMLGVHRDIVMKEFEREVNRLYDINSGKLKENVIECGYQILNLENREELTHQIAKILVCKVLKTHLANYADVL